MVLGVPSWQQCRSQGPTLRHSSSKTLSKPSQIKDFASATQLGGGVTTISKRGGADAAEAVASNLAVYLVDAWKDRALLGGKRRLRVKAWATVRDVKCAIAKLIRMPPANQRLFFRSRELRDHRTLEESGIHRSGATLLFDARVANHCLPFDQPLPPPMKSDEGENDDDDAP